MVNVSADSRTEDGWSLFDVGETTFNNTAIAEAGKHLFKLPTH